MSILRPAPFGLLARRLFRELAQKNAAFDLPARRFVRGEPDLDLSIGEGSHKAAVPFGPAAGPHTQLAQNIVLSWLAGGRAIELKTVQTDDRLTLPRPCIDMREVGYNCEYSQELRVAESTREYVKGALLVSMLIASGKTGVLPSWTSTVYDASVGYNLAGIRGDKVDGYLRALLDARPIASALLAELPPDLRDLASAGLPPALVSKVTLSTFHGCPPSEIEAIAEHILTRYRLPVVIKLNPTLLGEKAVRGLLHDALEYKEIVVPQSAFEHDATIEEVVALCGRLTERARSLGLSFGLKLTNTLVVENRRSFFPSSVSESYLSGPPLHVLAMTLLRELRRRIGMEVPVSFSAGIDAHNVSSAIALDLAPVTVCTDWLKTGGYSRGIRFHEALVDRVRHAGAKTREAFILRAFGHEETALRAAGVTGEAADRALGWLRQKGTLGAETGLSGEAMACWVKEAARQNTESYVDGIEKDPRYHAGHHEKPPRKVGSQLTTFDCLTCDKCVAVCPNDALFTYVAPHLEVQKATLTKVEGGTELVYTGMVKIEERHQIAAFADFCNDCGNCDAFCPEDGGPQAQKPRFFGSIEALRDDPRGEGIFAVRTPEGYRAVVRSGGREVLVIGEGRRVIYHGEGFRIVLDPFDAPRATDAEIERDTDVTLARTTHVIVTSALSSREVNAVSVFSEEP